MILVWFALFVIGGFLRGTVAQVFSVLGVFAGLWAGLWLFRWLDGYWTGAQPALAFMTLRWVVSGLVGLATASLLAWWGDSLGRAVQAGPAGWVDRGGGAVIGAGVGILMMALVTMAALLAPFPPRVAMETSYARTTLPLMIHAAQACSLGSGVLPGGVWLQERFHRARRTAERAQRDSL